MTDQPLLRARKHYERPHALIVADDPDLVSFLSEGLPLGGFWTTVISSGLQVMEVFRLRQFDLILIDYGLHSFNAEELLLRLRGASTRMQEHAPRTEAPVVILSDTPVDLSPQACESMGVRRIFVAPIDLEDLVPQLHSVVDEWRGDHPTVPFSDALKRK